MLKIKNLSILLGMVLGVALSLAPSHRAQAAAPTFQAAGAEVSGTGSVTPSWPAHVAGDVALLFIKSRSQEPAVLSVPAGFAPVADSPQFNPNDNRSRLTVYWARATSSAMPSPTVADPGNHVYARILTYRGVAGSGDPWDVTGGGENNNNQSTVTLPSVTTTVDSTLIVQAVAHNRDNAGPHFSGQTNANLTGIVERSDSGTTAGNGGGIGIWDGVKATAGPTGDTTADITNNVRTAFLSIALRPPAVPTLVSAELVCGSSTQVEVRFSRTVTAATAQNAANYALSGGATVSAAVLGGDGQTVTLTTSTLVSGQLYALTVNNVTAVGGNPIAPNSQITFFSESAFLAGLQGNYFPNMTLSGTAVQRIDGQVNFDWGGGAPGVPGIGADNFSVRWTGFVTAPVTGNYVFRTRSDDGVRLYLNGNLIINNWTDHAATNDDSAPIALTAGQRYPVVMEYYENGGQAVAQLSWSGPATGGFQFIPASALSHCGGALPAPRAFYKLDEAAWAGAGAVIDSSGNGLNGTAMNGTVPVPAHVCNGAQFNGSNRYIQIGGLSNELNATASLAFWIRTTQTGNDTGWQAPGVTGVELAGGSDDIFWGWLDASGRIGVSVANDFTTKSSIAINNGVWRHVVLTRDHVAGQYRIYIDGVLNASGAIATGVIGTPFSSLGRIEDTGGTPEYLNGDLDEVRIYGRVLTDAEVVAIRDITRPCAAALHHVRIEHGGVGVTCEPASMTVKACADAACNTLYNSGPTTTTLSPAGWVGGDTINFTGSVVAQLRRTTPGVVTLDAGTTTPGAANPTQCFNGLTQTCSFDFRDTGFLFSAIPTQTAGVTSATHSLRAVRTDNATGVCTALFNGNVPNIELASECINPGTCQPGQQVTFNNNGSGTIAANNGGPIGSWTPRTLTFGANSTANFTLSYPDVGQLRLHARYNIAGSGNYMSGTSAGFVVRPADFTVTNIQRAADSVANPGATDAAGPLFIRAGESMRLTVTAVNAQGNPTPNFGRETPAEGVRLTATLAPGLGLTQIPALAGGVLAGGAFSAGVATVSDVTWSEVGIIRITPTVADADYLGTGDVTGTTTGNIGRFIPHHFTVNANAPVFATACTAGGFTYVGQPFQYGPGLEPQLTVTARNLAGGVTQNYRNTAPASQAFFKISNSSLTGKAYAAAVGTLDASGVTGPDPVILDNGNGTGTLTFGSGTGILFERGSPVAPFAADISLSINVIDADGVAYSTNPARFGQASPGNGIPFSTGNALRFGRLQLTAASGSQLLPLRVPLEAQYWTGTFFATNTLDSCTAIAPGNVGMGNYIGNLDSGETSVTSVTPLASGRGAIVLGAPGAGNNGSLDLAVNLGDGGTAAACPAFAPAAGPGDQPWLRSQWCGSAYDRDPAARARFGIRPGADERIFMRENY
jgi:MSHA biogenesis protein MshQ